MSKIPAMFNKERFATASMIYRNENKLTVEGLAERLGISRHKIIDYELKRVGPTLQTVITFCYATGQDINSFIDNGTHNNSGCSQTPVKEVEQTCNYVPPPIESIDLKKQEGKYFVRVNGVGKWISAYLNEEKSAVVFSY